MSNFDAFFEKELKPEIKELQKLKKDLKERFFLSSVVVLAGYIFIVGNLAQSDEGVSIIIATLMAALILVIIYLMLSNPLEKAFRKRITSKIVSLISDTLSYYPEEHISEDEYKASKLYSTHYDHFSGNNLIEGKYKGVPIKFSYLKVTEDEVEEERDSEGHTHTTTRTVTIFAGTFFIAEFNKKFKGEVLVLPKRFHIFRSNRMVILENPDFHNIFDVYSSDQILARYIISTSLMERLIHLAGIFGKYSIRLSFINSMLYLAISGLNPFVVNILDLDNKEMYEKHLKNIKKVADIVDYLNLTLNIWR